VKKSDSSASGSSVRTNLLARGPSVLGIPAQPASYRQPEALAFSFKTWAEGQIVFKAIGWRGKTACPDLVSPPWFFRLAPLIKKP
tara:strand:- start:3857 stop:4111 length:255 start_codon:yes stop_codon:yes gene_type:complete